MDQIPYAFTTDVCNLLSIPTLDLFLDAPSEWRIAAKKARRRVTPVELYLKVDTVENTADYYAKGVPSPKIDDWRIDKVIIIDKHYEKYPTDNVKVEITDIAGGLHSEFFKRLLSLASIQCDRFTFEYADLEKIDLAVFSPRKLTYFTIGCCQTIPESSRFLEWFMRPEQFYNLTTLNICETNSAVPVDLSDFFADVLVNGNLQAVVSEGHPEKSLLALTSKLMKRSIDAWMGHKHTRNRSCDVSKNQFDIKIYDYEMKADLMEIFKRTPTGTFRCVGSTDTVYVETTDYFRTLTFVARLEEEMAEDEDQWIMKDDEDDEDLVSTLNLKCFKFTSPCTKNVAIP
ncbi:hypothetical protein QR680_003638 [Steinernema hermaphroditum]|uniref:Uncharacterized protein n=1 Tax=Steinernema hermaphroditum TaxID=289476 RepID=A0AA39HL15_9BILA|nr:hypothetical protein QR680_003638 [Steinernema hermaphroditum]